MAIAQSLLLWIKNPLGHEVHLGQGFQKCQNGSDLSLSPFLLLATLEANSHLKTFFFLSLCQWQPWYHQPPIHHEGVWNPWADASRTASTLQRLCGWGRAGRRSPNSYSVWGWYFAKVDWIFDRLSCLHNGCLLLVYSAQFWIRTLSSLIFCLDTTQGGWLLAAALKCHGQISRA